MGTTVKSIELEPENTDNLVNVHVRVSHQNISNNNNNFKDDISIETSVLDEELLVRGTSNLYVADASAIPIIPNGNVHSTVTIIASMAADFLRKKLLIFSPFL